MLKQVDYDGAYSLSDSIYVPSDSSKNTTPKIYPVPSGDELFAEMKGIEKVIITSLRRESRTYVSPPDLPVHKMDISPLRNGVYFIRVFQNET